MSTRSLWLVASCWLSCMASAAGQEIGFVEDFVFADDRQQALSRLVPGTDDYFYYHALHLQHQGRWDEVDALHREWINQLGHTARAQQIERRQAMLRYSENPQRTLAFLTQQLGLRFDHQREIPDAERDLPARLDPNLVTFEAFAQRALAHTSHTDGFLDGALDRVAHMELDPTRLRHLLQRLQYPDIPHLVDLIVRDLRAEDRPPFGYLNIHRQLTREQLEALARQMPELLKQTEYVNIYLSKLSPSADAPLLFSNEAQREYLDRAWSFVRELDPVFNSLKAAVLLQRLTLDRSSGEFDKNRLLDYLKIPKQVPYVRPEWLRNVPNPAHLAELGKDFRQFSRLMPIPHDEPVVRYFLMHYLRDAASPDEFAPYIASEYLRPLFAEVKITSGQGDPQQWATWLTPEAYRALMQRVDLEFDPTLPRQFQPDQPVTIKLTTKNVTHLIVKVFEINTGAYYRLTQREIDTDINIDGLVPHEERTYQYDDPPLRRVEREFSFDSLKGPGVWVIDFIGNGTSSRALIRKGALHHVVETTVAGQMFTIFDGEGQRVNDARLWIAGREYLPLPTGEIVVPFTTRPSQQQVIISRGSFSSLAQFQHESETYELTAGIHVDRESLIRHRKASAIIRPQLYLNGVPVSNELLKDVRLQILAVDGDGIPSIVDAPQLKWSPGEEMPYEFQVPAGLRTLRLVLTAKVSSISETKDISLSSAAEFAVNSIDDTASIKDLHLLPTSQGFVLEARGKSGEPLPRQVVQLSLVHRLFRDPLTIALQTNANGQIELGPLAGIRSIQGQLAGNDARHWQIEQSNQVLAASYHVAHGEPLVIPYDTAGGAPSREEFALLEMRDKSPVADKFDAISLKPGALILSGLEAGDYVLVLKSSGETATIRVADGRVDGSWIIGQQRALERRQQHPLVVAAVSDRERDIEIQLGGNMAGARVHVMATRYWPRFDPLAALSQVRDAEPLFAFKGWQWSAYLAGRDIGDEYRYILERKYARKYPGNTLDRPSLILQPWSRQTTESTVQRAAEGGAFDQANQGGAGMAGRTRKQAETSSGNVDPVNLDFLPDGSVVLWNLVPDHDGRVVINKDHLDDRHVVTILVVNGQSTQRRTLLLPVQECQPRDLRLANGLDPQAPAALTKRFRVLRAGDTLVIEDLRSARFQTFSTVADAYRFFQALTGDAALNEFHFVAQWPDKSDAEKRELYSQYACHELNLFLAHKDPPFFREVVAPFLKNKRAATMVDHWLGDAALEPNLEPWRFQQLNVLEKLLLARRLPDQRASLVRHIHELYQLNPTPRAAFDRLLDVALNMRSLSGGHDEKGLVLERQERMNQNRSLAESDSFGRMSGVAGGGGLGGVMSPGRAAAHPPAPADALSARRSQANGADRSRKSVDLYRSEADGRFRDAEETFDAAGEKAMEVYFNTEVELKSGLLDLREQQKQQLYRRLPPTQEWVETHYYKQPLEQIASDRVRANRFWRDYADHVAGEGAQPFLSPYFPEAGGNFTEIMCALAVLDLPFVSPQHELKIDNEQLHFTAGGDVIVYYQQVQPAERDPDAPLVLVSENFFRNDDRYRMEGSQRQDQFIKDEFLVQVLYGAQVVLTNPNATPLLVDLLTQIPEGALPAARSQMTRTRQLELAPFSTQTFEYYFYFPQAGEFQHFPAHVSMEQRVVAAAAAQAFRVVEQPSQVDRRSWAYLSQHGSNEEVLEYLRSENILAIDLSKMAFRLADRDFFTQAIELLRHRRAFHPTLWSYAIKHNDPVAIAEYLRQQDAFLQQLGPAIDSPLISFDSVERRWYEHREFWPLVNARAHRLGPRRQLTNPRIYQQYHQLLDALACRAMLHDEDRLALIYYLLLQDRVDEALEHFSRIDRAQITEHMQYDYLAAYLAMYREAVADAEAIARPYADHPHERWRTMFRHVLAQVEEIRGGAAAAVDARDRQQRQDELAARAPALDFHVEARQIVIDHRNLTEVEVRYYLMDIELLFSRNPFVQQTSDGFALIRPNRQETLTLEADRQRTIVELPAELRNANLLIEISGGGVVKSRAYYAHSLIVELQENYGQLRVLSEQDGTPLAKVYVKVFARHRNGTVEFYKDGYTDLRGRFDYVSLSNQSLDSIDRFALLILSEEHGAVVREAAVPKE